MSRSSMLQRGRPAKRHEVPFWNRRGWCRSQIRASHQDQCSRTREHRSGACLSLLTNRSNAKEDRRTDWVTSILCLQCLRSRIHGELSAGRDRQVGKEEIPIVTGRISLHATDDAFTSGSGWFRSRSSLVRSVLSIRPHTKLRSAKRNVDSARQPLLGIVHRQAW